MKLSERLRAAARAYKLGAGLDAGRLHFGTDPGAYSPAEYGDYISTSNNVYAVTTQRAQMLASLPLVLYKQNSSGDRSEVTRGGLWDLLHKVNPFWTWNRLIQQTELSLCLWGAAYLFLERGQSGRQPPSEAWWGRPDRVTVVPDEANYLSHFIYHAPNGQSIPFMPSEVVWFPYPNPVDEFSGLAPLGAARLSADLASAAMQSNRNLFANGLQMGGVVFPKSGTTFTPEQAQEIEEDLSKRFKGVDKAHRWGVFRTEVQLQQVGFNPKDAEFLGALKWSLEEICRAYHWPLDLVGGQRTYENLNAAYKAAWTHCLLPEAAFIASELTEQLLPMFGNEADVCEFDSSGVEVLQEDEAANWTRAKEKITVGALTVNEWRIEQGLEPVPWGDVWWAQGSLTPVENADKPEPAPEVVAAPVEEPAPQEEPPAEEEAAQDEERAYHRSLEYGGLEHRRIWQRFLLRATDGEKNLSKTITGLLKRQLESVTERLKQGVEGAADNPFDMKVWVKRFREEARPAILAVITAAANEALADLGLGMAFDVLNPAVVRFLEGRAQRFAQEVNDTTWKQLKESLGAGIEGGEGIPKLQERVEQVMGDRIRSTPETIARTEVIGASNGGTLEAWKQSGVVKGKVWLAALDDRTRDSHREAHGQQVGIDEDFRVGGAAGPAPGQMGVAEEDINCRCTMTAVV